MSDLRVCTPWHHFLDKLYLANLPLRSLRATLRLTLISGLPVDGWTGCDFSLKKALGINQRLTGSQTLASCDYWLPWEFLYPSTAVTGLTGGARPSAPIGALSNGRVDQSVAKKWLFFNRPSDGTDSPEP
ncbi:hypothetical protein B0H16DRAFT_1459139 [Mycena metata]|uniref:Uncharacterized protein n=1 Tax=Mycena metata TaxID=1033252 RepID=A0AAD7J1P9_9AGAR|nr:hypothetical protein B0H16DRAFT_1459139 [Mycena metata]